MLVLCGPVAPCPPTLRLPRGDNHWLLNLGSCRCSAYPNLLVSFLSSSAESIAYGEVAAARRSPGVILTQGCNSLQSLLGSSIHFSWLGGGAHF